MKTILYNPIFINPQAYYVFPRLTRYLQPDNKSTAEPANYIGTIEVKVIAYGDTTLKRTYTNTDSIDLSEFKNTWIRISLFTKVGSCVLGEWKIGNMESDLPYIDPEVLASLKAVVIVGNKTNNDSDRAIVKNLVDPDNPFVISNAAYTEGSGYADKGSPYYGAFVTDGVDDLITSTKTVQEMGITDKVTVVSMIHQIDLNSTYTIATTNYIENSNSREHVRSDVYNYGKTGIYGYSASLINNTKSDIKNILGDEADYYVKSTNSLQTIFDAKFSVVGRISELTEASQVAWYWTIIANKVLTTDQINQVIAYFNLDRTLKPDILCDVKKQGITNENHAEFGDKLIDFSGNGRDIQLNNIAWKGDSGIGKYEVDFLDSSIWTSSNSTITSSKIDCKNAISHIMLLYYNVGSKEYPDIPSFKVIKTGADIDYSYIDETGSPKSVKIVDGVNILPASHNTLYSGSGRFCGFGNPGMGNSVTITQIPSHAGALCLDGVNDFGKVTGMPIYKDYTVVADYERLKINIGVDSDSPILSKSELVNLGAFMFNTISSSGDKVSYSFGRRNIINADDTIRKIFYQSKYINDGQDINIESTFVDSDKLWLGTYRDSDYRFIEAAIYSLMSFPYSMSEFLIERQLKKHKLGTLYPDMVEFRPIVKSNSEYQVVDCYIDTFPAVVGNYYPINSKLRIAVTTKGAADEVTSLTVNGVSLGTPSVNGNRFTFNGTLSDKSPQKINITIDEYIRYEDIAQPYPVLLRFNDENGNEVSWGGKFRVGSTITRIGSAADSNLLPNIYNIFGLLLNDNQVTSSKVIVEKTMVFKAKSAYIFDNNEPNCILSPRLLRIPNSSYKILGHIPDISGHRNHGKINNSAYAGMSGANGYKYDYKNFLVDKVLAQIDDDRKVTYFAAKNSVGFFNANSASYKGRIKLTGVKKAIDDKFIDVFRIYTNSPTNNEAIDIYEDGEYDVDIKGADDATRLYFFALTTSASSSTLNTPIVIEQIGEYEGAYCFDGVNDFVTIPTLVTKQSLIKCNWTTQRYNNFLVDYRKDNASNGYSTNKTGSTDNQLAYNGRVTYIDGILNKHITPDDLKEITHNIIVQYPNNIESEATIACAHSLYGYMTMALWDYISFPEISTDDKIKELNEYVGIEAKVELPPYYWDAYGKTNLDADKATIQQRGVAVGDYDLTNHNHAYEGMSGYNGYPVVFGANKTWDQMPTGTFTWNIEDNKLHITKALIAGNGLLFSYVKLNGSLLNVKEIPSFKIKVSGLEGKSKLWYRYLKTEDAISETIAVLKNGIHELPKSYTPSDSLHDGVWVGFTVSPISEGVKEFDCDITIEVLPEYENGLVYDGVDDYSKNENIPVLTDYTIIAKRLWINKDNPLNEQFIHKGAINTPISESAFMLEYEIANDTYYRSSSYGGYINIERSNRPERIVYQTSNSYNGTSITKGSGTDTTGIVIGGVTNNYWNGVFYKLMLYSKTLPLLQINYLKNLMEKDEIIDLNNKIFIQE